MWGMQWRFELRGKFVRVITVLVNIVVLADAKTKYKITKLTKFYMN